MNSILSLPLRESGTGKGTKTGVEESHLCYNIPAGKVATALTEQQAIYKTAEQRGKPASIMPILIYYLYRINLTIMIYPNCKWYKSDSSYMICMIFIWLDIVSYVWLQQTTSLFLIFNKFLQDLHIIKFSSMNHPTYLNTFSSSN